MGTSPIRALIKNAAISNQLKLFLKLLLSQADTFLKKRSL